MSCSEGHCEARGPADRGTEAWAARGVVGLVKSSLMKNIQLTFEYHRCVAT